MEFVQMSSIHLPFKRMAFKSVEQLHYRNTQDLNSYDGDKRRFDS